MQQMMNARKLRQKGINTSYVAPHSSMTESQHYEPGTPGFEKGRSRYDKEGDVLTPFNSFEELEQHRYDNQSAWDVAANGIIKTVGRTATSFIGSMLGGIAGGLTALYNVGTGKDDWWTAFWNNPLSNAMADVDDWFNENFQNYQSITQKQNSENGEWWKNMTGLNMWMDDVLTNTGFTLGMIGAATTGAGLLGAATKAMQGVGLVQKYGAQAAKAITILNSTAGEAATEALGAQREHEKAETQRINDYFDQQIAADERVQSLDAAYQQRLALLDQQFQYQRNDPAYQQYKQQIDQQYQQQRGQLTAEYEQHRQQSMAQMQDEANHLGLAVGLGNMAILGISNFNLAGRFVDNAYRNAVRTAGKSYAAAGIEIAMKNAWGQANVTGSAATGYGSRSALGNIGKRALKNIASEGVYEEMGQGALSAGAKSYYAYEDIDNYWRARLDPDSVDRTADGSHDFVRAVGNGLQETYGSADGWKEGFIGGITGMAFSMGESRDEFRNAKFARQAAKDLNNALANPKLQTQLQHFVAQSVHAQNMNQAAAEGNEGAWKTENDKSMFSLLSTFRRAGRMDDLNEMIRQEAEKMDGMSDEELEKLITDSTRTLTSDQQKAERRQSLKDEADNAIKALLKEGATIEKMEQARAAVEKARQEEKAAVDNAATVEQDAQRIQRDRRANQRDKNGARTRSRQATAKAQKAKRNRERAEKELNLMFQDKNGLGSVDKIRAEQSRKEAELENQTFQPIHEGPFVDADGNRMKTSDVHEQLKTNLSAVQKAVENYVEAIEEINRRTRGMFKKDVEDYLAYNYFLDKQHLDEGDSRVKKHRKSLPETFVIDTKKAGRARKLAKALGLPKDAVRDDEEHEGQVIVDTKDFTDEQFASFMMHGFIGQEHLSRYDQNGRLLEDSTKRLRDEMLESAMKGLEERLSKKQKKRFNRNEFINDMKLAGEAYEKAWHYRAAYAEAWTNPDAILTAKEKWMNKLKRAWARKKAKLRQAKMSVEQLGDLTEEQMRELDSYHYALAKAEKLRRAVKNYWDRIMPDVYEDLEDAFDNIKDPELRNELIRRIRERIDEYMSKYREEGNDEIEDVDAEELMARLNLNSIIPDTDPLWDKIDDETEEELNAILSDLGDVLKRLIKRFALSMKSVKKRLDSILQRDPDQEGNGFGTVEDMVKTAKDLLKKAGMSVADSEALANVRQAIKDKISKMSAAESNSRIGKALLSLLKQIDKKLDDLDSRKDTDSNPHSNPDASSRKTKKQSRRRAEPRPSPKPAEKPAAKKTDDLSQNPTLNEEKKAVNDDAEEVSANIRLSPVSGLGFVWHSVTGEFARRSNFTYETYHQIVKDELELWDEKHKDNPVDEDKTMHKIDALEGPGDTHTIAEWRRLQRRSEIVHARLSDPKVGAFGYIDSGKVSAKDDIHFLVTDSPVGPIIYLVHVKDGKKQIIGDLNEPDRNDPEQQELAKLWDALVQEMQESGNAEHESTKFKTHVANVYAGFLKYNGKDDDGNIQMTKVMDIPGSDDVDFYICGTDPTYDDMFGTARRGVPMVVARRPGNNGMTRRVAVPVVTNPFTADSVEAKVISAAVRMLDGANLEEFLKHFLWCTDVTIFEEEGTDVDTGETTKIYKIAVETRSTSLSESKDGSVGKTIEQTITVTEDGTVSLPLGSVIRANVSKAFLNQELGKTYAELAKKDKSGTLPSDYRSLLKQICSAAVESFQVHNSWITINPLTIGEDGSVSEEDTTTFHEKMIINKRGKMEQTLNDPANGVAYIVEFERVKDNENDREIINVLSLRGGAYNSGMPVIDVRRGNKRRMLEKMAIAVSRTGGANYDGVNYFMYKGVLYEYYLNSDKSVSDVTIADEQPNGNDAIFAEASAELSYVARHYNGDNIDAVIDQFFDPRIRSQKDALERLLKSIKEGKQDLGLSSSVVKSILGLHRPTSELDRSVATALVKHLRERTDISIIDNIEQGQHYVDQGQQILSLDGEDALHDAEDDMGVSFFLDSSGTVVLGFAMHKDGKPMIYLDPSVMDTETLIHEYTHLWTYVIRHTKPEVWKELIKELKTKCPDVWNQVIKAYGSRVHKKGTNEVDESKVADEVFAHITGVDYAKDFLNKLGGVASNETDNMDIIGTLRSIYKKLIDALLNILGIKLPKGKDSDMIKTMQDLVIGDLLSDNPLQNFNAVDEAVAVLRGKEPEVKAEPEVKEEKTMTVRVSDLGIKVSPQLINGIDCKYDVKTKTITFNSQEAKDAFMKRIGKDDGPTAHIRLRQPLFPEELSRINSRLGTAIVRNLRIMYEKNPAFNGISDMVESLYQNSENGRMSMSNFILAAELLLTESERQELWDEAKKLYVDKAVNMPHLMAYIGQAFNEYMKLNPVENDKMTDMFSKIQEGIYALEGNPDLVRRMESLIDGLSNHMDLTEPTDPISSLTRNERKQAHREALDMLTDDDIAALEEAGYSKKIYDNSPQSVKEWFRECVI